MSGRSAFKYAALSYSGKRKTFHCGYYGKQWEENGIGNWISLVIISPNMIKQQMCGHG